MGDNTRIMVKAHILGFPRIGRQREMKFAVEAYWQGKSSQEALLTKGKVLRHENWAIQRQLGLDFVTVGDFSWYDHVLDTAFMLGVIPKRIKSAFAQVSSLDQMFLLARGVAPSVKSECIALEMTKWFDTNYHYIVPELEVDQNFQLNDTKLLDEISDAQSLGYTPKPVLLGPLSFLWLAKGDQVDKLALLPNLIDVYKQILRKCAQMNVKWVQMDEPILCLALSSQWQSGFEQTYSALSGENIKILLTTYFSGLGKNTSLACQLPVAGLHIDMTRDSEQLNTICQKLGKETILSAGIIDGRNIWRADLSRHYQTLLQVKPMLKDRLWVGSSCSLLHTPVEVQLETKLDPEIKSWLAFATQKVSEISTLADALNKEACDHEAFARSDAIVQSRKHSTHIHHPLIKQRLKQVNESMFKRKSYHERKLKQKEVISLPSFPTTTIGSFPQTQQIRHVRKEFKEGKITQEEYEKAIASQIQETVAIQEALELDVLVHGEAERNDMVEYFGELLQGFAFTEYGWVQSYGSRCVKPPIIYGDVVRTKPMTLDWTAYAQSLTQKPMKGMLTGPVTMLSWSFVRDDQPRKETAFQIALALRDEIEDLEKNGIKIIQIDEPAFREGLPLNQEAWAEYLEWAVQAFRLASSVVKEYTQIHTHMCYSEFNDVIEHIAALDADVITIETSRSKMELLSAFEQFKYPNEIGPGVYDIHSQRVPTIEEMENLLNKALDVISYDRLWVNPDCGLKTRAWPETKQALQNMVTAAKHMRAKYANDKE